MNPLPTRINTLPLLLGFRYSFSRRRNRFIGVVSLVSLLGMALGVASLITVLSVMNGFADELRGRILSVVPHATVVDPQGPLANWQDWQRRVEQLPEVVAAAPYLEAKVLLAGSSQVQAVRMLGVEVGAEPGVSQVAERIVEGSFDALQSTRWGVVLGDLLARALGVGLGDQVEITVPVLNLTPLGNLPRRKRLTVVGIFAVGAQMDATHALVGLADGQALLRLGDSVHGLHLAYEDLFVAASMSARVASVLPPELQVVPWQQAERSLFSAVAMEKTVIAVLLLCVVAVAAFNIVSTLTMAVTEKRADHGRQAVDGDGHLCMPGYGPVDAGHCRRNCGRRCRGTQYCRHQPVSGTVDGNQIVRSPGVFYLQSAFPAGCAGPVPGGSVSPVAEPAGDPGARPSGCENRPGRGTALWLKR